MEKSTYYGLNLVQGTDIVNPLTNDVPNYRKIDEVMHDNAVAGITMANEVTNGTVHAIFRENVECSVIRFIATSNWKEGDSVTVDGVSVTALLPSGEIIPNGGYVINSNVLCILTGTNLTVFAERKKIDNANEINYKDGNVGDALDEVTKEVEELNEYTQIPIEEFFSEVEVSISSGTIYKKGERIFGTIYCRGSAVSSSSGSVRVGTINSKYRPKMSQACASYYNEMTGGQCFTPSTGRIGTSGYLGMYIGFINKTIGNDSYSWCTTEGFVFSYEL